MTSHHTLPQASFCRLAALLFLLFAPFLLAAGTAMAHPPGQHEAAPAMRDSEAGHQDSPHADTTEAAAHDHAAMTDRPTSPAEAAGHDHSAHEGNWAKTGFQRFLAWLGAFHPAATNFPIALLTMAALAELLHVRGGREGYRSAARFCLRAGAVTAAATAVLGWFYAGFDVAGDDRLLAAHRWNGSTVGFLALAALWAGERHWRGKGSPAAYRTILLLVALLAGLNGYLGGRMLYGTDHYAWPEPAHEEDHAHDDEEPHDHGGH